MQTYHKDATADFGVRDQIERDGKKKETVVTPVTESKLKGRLDTLHATHIAKVQGRLQQKDKPLPDVTVIQESVTIDDNGKARGILNCRVNGQHHQYRFNEANGTERFH